MKIAAGYENASTWENIESNNFIKFKWENT